MPRFANQPMAVPIIGLLGGIASGKSFVADELERLGCAIVDADKIGHQVLQLPIVQQTLRGLFGPTIFQDDGQVDRKKLGPLVFGDDVQSQSRRKQLESVVHPLIHERALEQIEALKASSEPPRAIVIDAPLLIEARWTEVCNYVFFVDTPDDVREQRARARGWTTEQWQDREAAQISLELKRQAATHFVPGDSTQESLHRRLDVLLNEMHGKG
jgi:dephospho-CoA kinase